MYSIHQDHNSVCHHCSWGPTQICSHDVIGRHTETLSLCIHNILLNGLTGELHACVWCLINSILTSPFVHNFLMYWDDIECIQSVYHLPTYEIVLSAQYKGMTGLQWWLICIESLINVAYPDEDDTSDIATDKNNMFKSKLLEWWIAMNLTSKFKFIMNGNNDLLCSFCDEEISVGLVHSFSMKQSFQFMVVMRISFLEALDCILASTSLCHYVDMLSHFSYYQRKQYIDVFEHLQGITFLCFEILEDAILMKNEYIFAICAEISLLCLQSLHHLLTICKRCVVQPVYIVSTRVAAASRILDLVHNSHFVVSVYNHLTLNLSNWNAFETGQTNVDPNLIAELVNIIDQECCQSAEQ